MSLDEALTGKEIPEDIKKNLTLVSIPFFSFDGEVREGQLVVHSEVAREVQEIFKKLFEVKFPIQEMTPVVTYNWDDDASMAANNTSAFNYRPIRNTNRVSNHSLGRAVDINPYLNPHVQMNGEIIPSGAHYDPVRPGTVTIKVADLFKSYNWRWGGDWKQEKDWQHFEKPSAG